MLSCLFMKVNKVCDCSDCGFGMALCPQCGQLICKRIIAKRKTRNMERLDHCSSCLMKPTKVIVYHHRVLGKIECYPWQGEVNDDFYPVDESGVLVKPGERVCGCIVNSIQIRMLLLSALMLTRIMIGCTLILMG